GSRGVVLDLAKIEAHELRAACPEPPDVLAVSAPCTGFSGCLPRKAAKRQKYLDLNELSFRGLFVALTAYADAPPKLVLFENVPRIQSAGRSYLDRIIALLHAHGYAVRETTHDCGELGGLAQRRRRFLL